MGEQLDVGPKKEGIRDRTEAVIGGYIQSLLSGLRNRPKSEHVSKEKPADPDPLQNLGETLQLVASERSPEASQAIDEIVENIGVPKKRITDGEKSREKLHEEYKKVPLG